MKQRLPTWVIALSAFLLGVLSAEAVSVPKDHNVESVNEFQEISLQVEEAVVDYHWYNNRLPVSLLELESWVTANQLSSIDGPVIEMQLAPSGTLNGTPTALMKVKVQVGEESRVVEREITTPRRGIDWWSHDRWTSRSRSVSDPTLEATVCRIADKLSSYSTSMQNAEGVRKAMRNEPVVGYGLNAVVQPVNGGKALVIRSQYDTRVFEFALPPLERCMKVRKQANPSLPAEP